MTNDDGTSYMDRRRTVRLWDVGGDGYQATVAVAPDGTETLLLANLDDTNDLGVTFDPRSRHARHEQLGRLPRNIRERIWDLRCGRPRPNGQPCRTRVTEPGSPCHLHADQQQHLGDHVGGHVVDQPGNRGQQLTFDELT